MKQFIEVTNKDQSSRNFGALVHTLVLRGKSPSEAVKIAEFSIKRKEANLVKIAREN